MRERVRQWEIRMLENAVGKERAAELLAADQMHEIVGGNAAAPARGRGRWRCFSRLTDNSTRSFAAARWSMSFSSYRRSLHHRQPRIVMAQEQFAS